MLTFPAVGKPAGTISWPRSKSPLRRSIFLSMARAAAVALLCGGTTHAVTVTWDGSSSDNWQTAANWTSPTAPVAGDTAVFAALGSPSASPKSTNSSNNNQISIGTMRFTTGGASFSSAAEINFRFWRVNNGGIGDVTMVEVESGNTNAQTINANRVGDSNIITIPNSSTATILHNGGGLLTIGSIQTSALANPRLIPNGTSGNSTLVVDGTGNTTIGKVAGVGNMRLGDNGAAILSLTKKGTGTLLLNTTNGYTGATVVENGTIKFEGATLGNQSDLTIQSSGVVEMVSNSPSPYEFTTRYTGDITGAGTLRVLASTTPGASRFSVGGDNTGFSGVYDVQSGARLELEDLNSSSQNARYIVNGLLTTTLNNQTFTLGSLEGGGTLQNGSTFNNATFQIGHLNTDTEFSGSIIVNFSVTKVGTGDLTLSGANTYTGTTTIQGGTLLVNGTHTTSGAYTVQNGGTLGGLGTISTNNINNPLNITLNAGGKLAPGASPGTLTLNLGTGTLNLSNITAGALIFELGALAASDKVVLTTGTLNLGSGANDLNFNDFSFYALNGVAVGNTYTLFDANSPLVGTLGSSGPISGLFVGGYVGGYLWLDNTNHNVMLTIDFIAVPEPGTLLLAAFGALGLAWSCRRKRPA